MCNGMTVKVEKDPAAKKTTDEQGDQDDDGLAPDGLPKKIKGSAARGPKLPSPASPAASPSSNPLRAPSNRGEGLQVPGIG